MGIGLMWMNCDSCIPIAAAGMINCWASTTHTRTGAPGRRSGT
jgi:hypothetical protein